LQRSVNLREAESSPSWWLGIPVSVEYVNCYSASCTLSQRHW